MRSIFSSRLFSRLKFRGLQALGLALLLAAPAHAATWTKVTPPDIVAAGIQVQLTGCDYGNGVFVLATYFGGSPGNSASPAVFTSTDGSSWTRRSLPSGVGGRTGAPRFLNGKFLLGVTPDTQTGGNGVICSSTDGVTWTASTSLGATINAPGEFTFGNNLYVAPIANTASQVATSTDGVSWTLRTIVAGGASSHVTFFKGKFYASNYNTGAGLYSSADGIVWTKVTGAPAGPGILAATSTTLLVTTFSGSTSGQSVSKDGATFTTASPGINLKTETVKVLDGAFVVTDAADAASYDLSLARASTDGNTWTTLGTTDNQYYATEVAYGAGRYVFVGEFNVYAGGTSTNPGGGGGTPAPAITAQPASQTVTLGGSWTFTVTATGTGLSYQWYFNGVALSGEINASLILSAITALQAGDYTVKITNAGGTVTSSTATLAVATASNAGRIVNMSVRANAGAGDQTLIVGLVIGGDGTTGKKPVLIRALGPTLAKLAVTGFLADPKITAFSAGTAVATNDDWAGDADIAAAGNRLGAYPFASAQSKDAAFYASPDAGAYSIHITGPTTGIALAEIYDGTDTPTNKTPRLLNVSVRAQVGTGDNLLITGFVIGGSTPRTVLIRALGPTLTAAGVTGVLADPTITLFSGSTKVAENDNWSSAANAAAVVTTSATVGAGPLVSGTKDAVILVTLQPGVYAAHVTGVGNTTGVALVEVFEAP